MCLSGFGGCFSFFAGRSFAVLFPAEAFQTRGDDDLRSRAMHCMQRANECASIATEIAVGAAGSTRPRGQDLLYLKGTPAAAAQDHATGN